MGLAPFKKDVKFGTDLVESMLDHTGPRMGECFSGIYVHMKTFNIPSEEQIVFTDVWMRLVCY